MKYAGRPTLTIAKGKNFRQNETMGKSGLTSKGRLTIPKDVRTRLSLKTGDVIAWTVMDGRLIGTPRNLDFADFAGFLGKPHCGPATIEEIDIATREAVGSHVTNSPKHDGCEGFGVLA